MILCNYSAIIIALQNINCVQKHKNMKTHITEKYANKLLINAFARILT